MLHVWLLGRGGTVSQLVTSALIRPMYSVQAVRSEGGLVGAAFQRWSGIGGMTSGGDRKQVVAGINATGGCVNVSLILIDVRHPPFKFTHAHIHTR